VTRELKTFKDAHESLQYEKNSAFQMVDVERNKNKLLLDRKAENAAEAERITSELHKRRADMENKEQETLKLFNEALAMHSAVQKAMKNVIGAGELYQLEQEHKKAQEVQAEYKRKEEHFALRKQEIDDANHDLANRCDIAEQMATNIKQNFEEANKMINAELAKCGSKFKVTLATFTGRSQ
jgi:hypothetical protein